MKRMGLSALCLALGLGLALPASADRREDRAALEALSASACTLSQAIENALAAVPGTVTRARIKASHKPGQAPVRFYKVVIFDEAEGRNVLRFDARTCAGIEPTPPHVPMLDAIATGLAEVGGGFPVATGLRFPGLEPVYRVVILLPRHRVVVYVDGVSGEVLGARKWHPKRDAESDAGEEESEDDSL